MLSDELNQKSEELFHDAAHIFYSVISLYKLVRLLRLVLAFIAHLTHCRLNRLPHTIYWKSPISILGMSVYEINPGPSECRYTLPLQTVDPDQLASEEAN